MTDVLDVRFLIRGEDEDVIQIDKHEPVQCVSEGVIDKGLGNNWGIGETKRHDQVFTVTGGVVKAVFHSSLPYSYKVISIPKV